MVLTGDRDPRISRPTPALLRGPHPAHFDSPYFPHHVLHDMHLSSLLPCHFLSPTPSPMKKTQTDRHRERCIEHTIKLASSRPGHFHPTSFFIFPRLSVPLLLYWLRLHYPALSIICLFVSLVVRV